MEKTIRVCDLHDGLEPATSMLEFSLDGTKNRLDLCSDHLLQVREALGGLLDDGRRRSTRPSKAVPGRVSGSRRAQSAQREQVREWARRNGFEVAARGRVPADAAEAFARASAD